MSPIGKISIIFGGTDMQSLNNSLSNIWISVKTCKFFWVMIIIGTFLGSLNYAQHNGMIFILSSILTILLSLIGICLSQSNINK